MWLAIMFCICVIIYMNILSVNYCYQMIKLVARFYIRGKAGRI